MWFALGYALVLVECTHTFQNDVTALVVCGGEATLIAMKFDRHFGSSAADVPVKFQSDTTI